MLAAMRTQLSRSRAKDNAKGYGICIPEELKEEKEEKATVEESVRPCTTLGRPKGQTSLAH